MAEIKRENIDKQIIVTGDVNNSNLIVGNGNKITKYPKSLKSAFICVHLW